MTKEEAKKMGATHYFLDNEGQTYYYKYNKDSRSLMYINGCKFVFAHNPEDSFYIEKHPSLKPL